MRLRAVEFSTEARADLIAIYDYVDSVAGETVATGYTDRVEKFIMNLGLASERGQLRSEVRANLRIIGFERRLTVAFTVSETSITILRIFSGGQNWRDILQDDESE